MNPPPRFRSVVLSFSALLFCAGIFSTGVALYRLLIPHTLVQKGIHAGLAGTLVSAMALGVVLSAMTGRVLLYRSGHVRTFCASAATLIASLLLLQLVNHLLILGGILLIIGFCASSSFLSLESWLHQQVRQEHRGKMFGGYLMVFYAATILGQYAINVEPFVGHNIVLLPAMLLALSILPLALTTSSPPAMVIGSNLPFRTLWRHHRHSVVGMFLGFSCISPIIFAGPLIAQAKGLSTYEMSIFLIASSLGAMSFQFPIGALGDRVDRRKVLLVLHALIMVSALALLVSPANLTVLFVVMFCLGGSLTCLYPTYANIAFHAMPNQDITAAAGKFLYLTGFGGTVGVMVVSWLLEAIGVAGFVGYVVSVSLALIGLVLTSLKSVSNSVHQEGNQPSITLPLATINPHMINSPLGVQSSVASATLPVSENDENESEPRQSVST